MIYYQRIKMKATFMHLEISLYAPTSTLIFTYSDATRSALFTVDTANSLAELIVQVGQPYYVVLDVRQLAVTALPPLLDPQHSPLEATLAKLPPAIPPLWVGDAAHLRPLLGTNSTIFADLTEALAYIQAS